LPNAPVFAKITRKLHEAGALMHKFFKSRLMKSMLPYLILAFAAIVLFRLTAEFRIFTDAIGRFFTMLSPFLTGAIFAYIFNLPCTALQRLIKKIKNPFIVRKSRLFSVLLLIVIVILVVILILNLIIPAVVDSIEMFGRELPTYQATIMGWIDNLNEWDIPDFLAEYLSADAISGLFDRFVYDFDFSIIVERIILGLGGAASAIFHAFLAIVSCIYLLIEKDKFKAFAMRLFAAIASEKTNETVLKYCRKLDHNFRAYIYTQTIDGIILGTLMTIVLFIFGSPFFLVLGIILGIVNYIPYFGSIFGTAFAVLVLAFTQGIWPTAVIAAIIMFAIQQFDGNVLQPKLMGGTFSLSPLLVIVSVTAGMFYGGIFGMLVAIPIVAIFKDLIDEYIVHREETKNVPKPTDDDFMDRDIW